MKLYCVLCSFAKPLFCLVGRLHSAWTVCCFYLQLCQHPVSHRLVVLAWPFRVWRKRTAIYQIHGISCISCYNRWLNSSSGRQGNCFSEIRKSQWQSMTEMVPRRRCILKLLEASSVSLTVLLMVLSLSRLQVKCTWQDIVTVSMYVRLHRNAYQYESQWPNFMIVCSSVIHSNSSL